MEEKKKSNLVCLALVIIFLVLVSTIGYLYYYGIVVNNKKINDLEKKVLILENEKNLDVPTGCESNENKEVSEVDGSSLFQKAIKEEIPFIYSMINSLQYEGISLSDQAMIRMLQFSNSEKNIFSNFEDSASSQPYLKASVSDVKNSCLKLFGKTVDINKAISATNNNSIRLIDDYVVISADTGVGLFDAELVSVNKVDTNKYEIKFKFIRESALNNNFKITILYNNGNIVYENISMF